MRAAMLRESERVVAIVAAAGLALSCGTDPLRENAVEALGGEQPGVAPGPLHRPGQPCAVCHSEEGDAPAFVLAGTVFRTPTSGPLAGATVRFIDATGAQYATRSNCVGNFFVRKAEFDPKRPLWVKIEHEGKSIEMRSAIFREASCAACHEDPPRPDKVGRVYGAEDSGAPLEAEERCP
jgi:hypothetical protein